MSPPLILCIDTATDVCSVALGRGAQLLAYQDMHQARAHAKHLPRMIEEVLECQHLSVAQLGAVCVAGGPGSYTGLRVGVATAKGLCHVAGIPLIEVSTLLALADAARAVVEADYYLPMLDARRMEVYSCLVDREGRIVRSFRAEELHADSYRSLTEGGATVAVVGTGAEKFRKYFGSNTAFVFPDIEVSARHMLARAYERFQAAHFEDLARFEPRYLKPPNITRPKKFIL